MGHVWMKVLHVYNEHRGGGGADSATHATIAALRGAGVEVDEFAMDSRTLPGGLAGKFKAFVNGLYAADALRSFDEQLRIRRPDVLHVHELYPMISPWVLPRARAEGIPIVMSVYDYRLTCPVATHHVRGESCLRCQGGREYWCVMRNCRDSLSESLAYALRNATARHFGLYTRNVDRYMAISQYQTSYLTGQVGALATQVVVNPCVVPAPEAPVEDPSRGGYVAYAGRFVPEKGVEVMVEACRRLGLPMGFAGSSPAHPAVRDSDAAHFVMTKTKAELAAFYRGARLLVVPSTWPETFGIVAAEAMSHGVPVVASAIGALTEVVLDGVTGLHARPGDATDLADKIGRIWNDPGLARVLGQGAYEHVSTRYSAEAHANRLIRCYGELIAS